MRAQVSSGRGASGRDRSGSRPSWCKSAWGYLNALFHRIKRKGGPKKAIIAVAASMLRALYYMLRDHVPYKDLGADHFSTIDTEKKAKRLIRQLADMGVEVAITNAG